MSKRRSLTEAQCVSLAQKLLRERLCHQKLPDRPVALDSQYKHLLELLRRTAVHGESNSVLIVGPRGSGKTMVRSIKRFTPLLITSVAEMERRYTRKNVEPKTFSTFIDEVLLSSLVCLCVLQDVLELLEKRVKSRFSHRQIHLFSSLSFAQYVDAVRAQLSLPPDFPDPKFSDEWNQSVTKLCEEKSVEEILRRHFNGSKDFRSLHSLLFLSVSRVSVSHSTLREADLLEASRLISADSKAIILHGLSILELCLIIAMKHLNDTYDGEPFNFQMVHNEFKKFIQRKSHSIHKFEKPVVMKAFEHLLQLELVRPVDSGVCKVQREYQLMRLMLEHGQVMEALQRYPQCPTDVKQWALSAFA
uniref:Origin recognition complex subunit 4 n=1 Tax=Cyprinus carpio TaxID=7962 RepID=A0A8C2IX56_CYPCA